ncbi:MAG: DUF4864 domain-containing protein [Rhodobacterales bacterium]
MKNLIVFISILFFYSTVIAETNDDQKIQGVISQQISSFQVDDFAKAFTFASPSIKKIFGNSNNFGKMVRRGFPMVWRTKVVDYLKLLIVDGALVQRVMITDINDEIFILNYIMVETIKGWKIRGVTIDQRPLT